MSSLRSRLWRHIRANVVAYLALFVALGGTSAYAANTIGSADVIDDSLLSQDIKDANVKNADLANDAITTTKIKTGNVGSTDLAANAVSATKVADNSLGGGDINESKLDLDGFFAAASGSDGGCPSDTHTPNNCGSTTISLPRSGRVLATATGEWTTFALDDATGVGSDTDDPTLVRGACNLAADGSQIGGSQTMGERETNGVSSHPQAAPGTLAVTASSGVLAAGNHTIEVDCTEQDGDLDWSHVNIDAALVGPG